ncbi:MAG: M4 family metallopeptidase, partial [Anaerolineae bacterium]|nr:M4 family metallopeptidase [Anaerolineae bacterium]
YNFIGIDSAVQGSALPGATALQQGTPSVGVAMADLSLYARQFGISNPSQELQFTKASAFQQGSRSFRFRQVYQGVPVLGGELIANYDRVGRLAAIVGEASPQLKVSTTPRLPANQATRMALGYVAKAEELNTSDLTASTPALWIYDPRLLTPEAFEPTLAWRIEVRAAAALKPIRYLILVDALNGGVLLGFNQIDTAWHGAAENHRAEQPIVAQPAANAVLPILNAPQFAPNYANPSGVTYNSNHSDDLQGSGLSTMVCNTPPTALSGAGSCGLLNGDPFPTIANAAHFYAYNTFNYFDSHHNRNSIDDSGMALISNVNYCEPGDCPLANAFWDGQQMIYGDGGFFAADDVVAHELTHGVTEFSSSLFYFYESGAINESMSDIFGELLDQSNASGTDSLTVKWQMGEDVAPFGAIRNMANPPIFDQPDRTQSALYWKYTGDNGGVHFNSGVSNKAAYLMAQGGTFNGRTITALGNDKTSAIFYEVNTNLLTSGADFSILGAAIVQACNNILAGTNPLGMTPANCAEANEATLATEMQIDPVAAVVFRPKADVCPANYMIDTVLFTDDMESGLGNYTSRILQDDVTVDTEMPEDEAWQDAAIAPVPLDGPYATSGISSAFGANFPSIYDYITFTPYDSALEMNSAITLPVGSAYYLHFNHSFAFEFYGTTYWDGAVLEYTVNGGATWLDAGSLYEAGQNYNGTIFNDTFFDEWFRNPLRSRKGFVQTSHGYVSTRYNLKSLAGQNVRFRWRIGADSSASYLGWYLDDIQVYNCISTTAAPSHRFTNDTTPRVTWTRITWATSYEIQISTSSTFTGTATSATYSGLSPSNQFYDIPDVLTPGTWYWRIRAYEGTRVGTWSPVQTIIIGS